MSQNFARCFIIRPDGTTSTVTSEQLNTMRLNGLIGPDDKVVPIPSQTTDAQTNSKAKAPTKNVVTPANHDIDTAPLGQTPTKSWSIPSKPKTDSNPFSSINDFEIDQAFSSAQSQNLYHMDANSSDNTLDPLSDTALDSSQSVVVDDKPRYHIQFSDGQVLGPFDSSNIWERFEGGLLSGHERIALSGSESFKPILSYVDFKAAFKLFETHTKPKNNPYHLESASVAPFLLELSHQMVTGWLLVKQEQKTFLLTLSVGKLLNVRINQVVQEFPETILNNLFMLDSGIAWFEADAKAAEDYETVNQDVLSLTRHFTQTQNGFALSRLIETIGDQSHTLQIKNKPLWYTNHSFLTPLEEAVTKEAELGHTIAQTLHTLLDQNGNQDECLHSIFMAICTNSVGTVSKEVAHNIKQFTATLFSNRFAELLQLRSTCNESDVQLALQKLKIQIEQTTQHLANHDPLIKQIQDRFNYIKKIVTNKAERYVLLRSLEENTDIREDAKLAYRYKIEFLKNTVPEAIRQRKYLETLPEAELFYELDQKNPLAFACFVKARFYASQDQNETNSAVSLLDKGMKKFPTDQGLLKDASQIYTDAGYFKKAQGCLNKLGSLAPKHKDIAQLEQSLQQALLKPYDDSVTKHSPWLRAFFISLVTLIMTGLIWLLAVDIELGKSETFSRNVDHFIWVRGGILTFFSMIGFYIVHRQGWSTFFKRLNYRTTAIWASVAIIIAAIFSMFFDTHSLGRINFGFLPVVVILFSVATDRLYFTAFLGQDLFQTIKNKWISTSLLAILYGIYFLTFYEVLNHPTLPLATQIFLIFFTFSLPLALLQNFSRSVLAPVLFHLSYIATDFVMHNF